MSGIARRSGRAGASWLTVEAVSEAVEQHALKLTLAFLCLPISAVAIVYVLLPITTLGLSSQSPLIDALFRVADELNAHAAVSQIALYVLSALLAVWLSRRGALAVALYLGVFGFRGLWLEFSRPGRPFGLLAWEGPKQVDFWWVVLLVLIGLGWLVRRELTSERVGALLFIVLVTGLLRQSDFISNKFSIFGFTGMGSWHSAFCGTS